MLIVDLLQANVAFYIANVAILGLMLGSFLNVVIHRLPIMMEREWRQQCSELAESPTGEEEPYNLVRPRSRCPKCGHSIGVLENIPIISYLIQKGRCRDCGTKISARYPTIEPLTAVSSAFVAWHFGFGWESAGALIITWSLIALTFIDLDHHLLPDSITLPLLWLGLLASLHPVFADTRSRIIGAVAGYLSLWLVYQLFKLVTGKEGMGYGDFKLLGMLGAWMGRQALPVIIIISSLVGAVVGITLILFRLHERANPISFGPYLAAAGWITLLWGEEITGFYFRFAGISH